MTWLFSIVLFVMAMSSLAINRPVYKIVLTQKGFAQFLQYDIDTPPLKEFTFCTWFRLYDLKGEQSIFSYVTGGNERTVRLGLTSGGEHLSVSFDQKLMSKTQVEITKDVWRHVCLTYQADYGAWAIYLDSQLIFCQASQTLRNSILPGRGNIIIGYGTDDNGHQNGLEGEIFGANMILISTIENNATYKNYPFSNQKSFLQNKLRDENQSSKYVILNDLQTGEVINNFEATHVPTMRSATITAINHQLSSDSTSEYMPFEIDDWFNFSKNSSFSPSEKSTSFASTLKPKKDKIKTTNKGNLDVATLQERALPTLSEYEVPPTTEIYNIFDKSLELDTTRTSNKANSKVIEHSNYSLDAIYEDQLSDTVKPPPVETNTKYYGQWTSSNFAGNVLNYLKNLNLHVPKKRVPPTISLTKISDSYPYPSDFKPFKVRPGIAFRQKTVVQKQQSDSKRMPQINVQILEDDLRSNIIRNHAQTAPKNVKITNHGIKKKSSDHRFYRSINTDNGSGENNESSNNKYKPRVNVFPKRNQNTRFADVTIRNLNLMTILPFIRPFDSYKGDSDGSDSQNLSNETDVYTKSLSQANKWHNVKSYSNDFAPHEIKIGSNHSQRTLEEKIAEANKKNPSVRLKYRYDDNWLLSNRKSDALKKARELAKSITDQLNFHIDPVKYNNRYLIVTNNKYADKIKSSEDSLFVKTFKKDNFHTPIKIGNALNEQPIIGRSQDQNKRSFIGGDEKIPDINKFRTKWDKVDVTIPGSLDKKICKNLESVDDILYVHPDRSIHKSRFYSPIKDHNVAMEFVIQNYKMCSLQDSDLQNNAMLFIDWIKTPVRLFGGAIARKTTDLCGFFK